MSETNPHCVPGASSATAADTKFVKYLLDYSRDHGKAAFFGTLGFNTRNWEDLRTQMLEALPTVEAAPSTTNGGGG